MTAPRRSNRERAEWRSKCRRKLSDHLRPTPTHDWFHQANKVSTESTLGLTIEPLQVRLITHLDDSYIWKALPEKQHLFEKHLSKHSVGAYVELCRGVGISFEAVPALAPTTDAGGIPQDEDRAELMVNTL
jgi:hypothetical protein